MKAPPPQPGNAAASDLGRCVWGSSWRQAPAPWCQRGIGQRAGEPQSQRLLQEPAWVGLWPPGALLQPLEMAWPPAALSRAGAGARVCSRPAFALWGQRGQPRAQGQAPVSGDWRAGLPCSAPGKRKKAEFDFDGSSHRAASLVTPSLGPGSPCCPVPEGQGWARGSCLSSEERGWICPARAAASLPSLLGCAVCCVLFALTHGSSANVHWPGAESGDGAQCAQLSGEWGRGEELLQRGGLGALSPPLGPLAPGQGLERRERWSTVES